MGPAVSALSHVEEGSKEVVLRALSTLAFPHSGHIPRYRQQFYRASSWIGDCGSRREPAEYPPAMATPKGNGPEGQSFCTDGHVFTPPIPGVQICDYDMSVVNLYKKITTGLIQSEKGLRPLVGLRPNSIPDLPSWAIDLSQTPCDNTPPLVVEPLPPLQEICG